MAAKKKSSKQMIEQQIVQTNENLNVLEKGSKERQLEAAILKDQIETQLAIEKADHQKKLDEERLKNDILYNENKLAAEEAQHKKENALGWAKVVAGVAGTVLYTTMGWLKLKENMTQGREQGSDAEPWWKEALRNLKG